MTRSTPISITYALDRNNDEPVELLVTARVYPPEEQRSANREAPSVDYPDGALVELHNGEPIGPWAGRLTAAEEAEVERAVVRAWELAERECA